MLGFLVELVISLGICGALAYFLFLSAPVDELGTSAGTLPSSAYGHQADDGGAQTSQQRQQQPLPDTWWAPLVPWYPGSPLHGPYRYLLEHVLHMEDPMAGAYQSTGGGEGGSVAGQHATAASCAEWAGPALGGGTPPPPAAAGGVRRGRRGRGAGPGAGIGGGPQGPGGHHPSHQTSPLRRESTHWVSVLIRWVGILLLGGGTTSHEVWSDRVWCGVHRIFVGVNSAWEAKMRVREGQRRALGPHQGASSSFTSRTPLLLQLSKLELGPGAARDPPPISGGGGAGPREAGDGGGVSSLNTSPGVIGGAGGGGVCGGGSGGTASGAGGGQGGVLSSSILGEAASSLAASLKLNAGTNLAQWGAATAAGEPVSPGNSGVGHNNNNSNSNGNNSGNGSIANIGSVGVGGGSGGSPAALAGSSGADGGNTHQHQQQQQRDGEGGAGLSTSTSPAPPQQHPPHSQLQQQPGASAPTVGIVLPRVAGEIVSFEMPFVAPAFSGNDTAAAAAAAAAADTGPTSTPYPANAGAVASTPVSASPPMPTPLPLRCFCVPLVYEDSRFQLRMGCCLPLAVFLPASLAIPADVLSLDCSITIRRVNFHGALYAAFHGPRVELSFPVAPQFTAQFDVARPPSRGGRMASSATTTSAFIATSTMRNVVSVGGHALHANNNSAGGGGGGRSSMAAGGPLAPYGSGGTASMPQHQQQPQQQQQQHGQVSSHTMASQQQQQLPGQGQGQASQLSPAAEQNGKIQEMVLLAVMRAMASITYPNVLEGRVNLARDTTTTAAAAASGQQQQQETGMFLWARKVASLPLYT